MLFSSVPFLFYFLPIVLISYFLAPRRAKNSVLLLSSLVFYGWGEPRYLPVMLGSILQGYVFGRLIERFRGTKRAKLFLPFHCFSSLFFDRLKILFGKLLHSACQDHGPVGFLKNVVCNILNRICPLTALICELFYL